MALLSPKAGLAGTWEGTSDGTCMQGLCIKGGKETQAKIPELRVTPYLPADVELGTLCATAATFLFPHSDGLVPDCYLCERGRDRLETENGLKSFKNL